MTEYREDTMSNDDEFDCKVCGSELIVPAYGPKTSPILLVGDSPGKEEMEKGIPFIGKTGDVLRAELAFLGIDIKALRRCNMWLHEPNDNDGCKTYGIEKVIQEAAGKKLVLLIGSDTVKYFTKKNVSDTSGLIVTSLYLSAPCMACVQPTTVFHGSLGEFRLTMQKFAKKYYEIEKEEKENEWR